MTPFGSNHLGIASYIDDAGEATSILDVSDDPIGDVLGPFPLTYPFRFFDYGDIVNASAAASVAFKAENSDNNLSIDKDGGIGRPLSLAHPGCLCTIAIRLMG